jgi:hypothetical protein
MSYTLQNTLNYVAGFIQGQPIYAWTGFEPACSIATTVRNTICNAPIGVWPWNRNENSTLLTLTQGVQDYTIALTDFAYLEKITLQATTANTQGVFYQYEIKNIHNTYILGMGNKQAQPDACCVKYYTPGTSVALRFLGVPDQDYTAVVTYQKLVVPFAQFAITSVATAVGGNTTYTGTFTPTYFTAGQLATVAGFANALNNGTYSIVSVSATTLVLANPNGVAVTAAGTVVNSDWMPIPHSFIDIYNNLFLAEAFSAADDARTQEYRVRGIAALLSKAEGLSDMQINAFLSQWIGSSQEMRAQLRAQTANQARST